MRPFYMLLLLIFLGNLFFFSQDSFTSLTHLVQLDLSKNSLTELPEDFGKLIKLKKLDLLNNSISKLPLSFGKLKNLVWLDLKGNPIQEILPEVVGDCLRPIECQTCARNVSFILLNINCVFYFL